MSRSAAYAGRGMLHRGSNTRHLVPGQYNGRHIDPLMLIGDKNGQGIAIRTRRNPDVLAHYQGLFASLKCLVMHRDLDSHKEVFVHGYKHLRKGSVVSAEKTFMRCVDSREAAIEHVSKAGIPMLHVHFNELINHTVWQLHKVLAFLGLPTYINYAESCASIVVRPPPFVRNLQPGRA